MRSHCTEKIITKPSQKSIKNECGCDSSSRTKYVHSFIVAEIFTLNAYTILFKVIDELQIYLIVQDDENYVLMEKVIDTLGEVLLLITKGPYTGKIIFDYLHDIVLAVD